MNSSSIKRHLLMLKSAFGKEISELFENTDIIEIMVNPDGKLWFETLGNGKKFTGTIIPPHQVSNIIKLVAASHHAIANADHPELSCELPETGARFQAWLPPVADTPTFTIRIPASKVFPLSHYLAKGGITQEQMQQLQKAVHARKNILIAGGTGSGKTTFANALLNELKNIPERIVVLEDLPELKIETKDCVKLRTCATKTMRDLVKGSLRMNPDRIIIGEVRDGSALELLKAWNTGHPGGICTIHANSADSTLARLEDLLLEVVQTIPKRLIQQAIDVIVFMNRDKQGQHRVAELRLLYQV
jgi:type IV secretion system protein VirB11